jgi:hypothetical protein
MFSASEGVMLNLVYVLLLFCKPFLDRNPAQVKKIDQSYCLFSKLINFEKEARLFDFQDYVSIEVSEEVKKGNFGCVLLVTSRKRKLIIIMKNIESLYCLNYYLNTYIQCLMINTMNNN